MTNGWTDVANADVVLVMGGNPAENHPVGFRFVMEAKRHRKAKLVCIDPRFNRTAAVSDAYVQIRSGSDIAFLGGLIHYALTHDQFHADYVREHTNAAFLVKEDFDFQDGYFSGWDAEKARIRQVDLAVRTRPKRLRAHRQNTRTSRARSSNCSRNTTLATRPSRSRQSAAVRPRTSSGRPRSSVRRDRRGARARCCTRWGGRSTAIRCS